MFKALVLLSCIFLICHTLAADDVVAPTEVEDKVYDDYRLPTAITPENYKLEVITHLNDTEGFLFRGSVWITVRMKCAAESQWDRNK